MGETVAGGDWAVLIKMSKDKVADNVNETSFGLSNENLHKKTQEWWKLASLFKSFDYIALYYFFHGGFSD